MRVIAAAETDAGICKPINQDGYYSDGIYKLSVTIRDMADNTTTQEATSRS